MYIHNVYIHIFTYPYTNISIGYLNPITISGQTCQLSGIGIRRDEQT